MRLLKRSLDSAFQLESFHDNPPPYAILSHTWTEGHEVLYNELVTGTGKDKTGYAKIRFCAERAALDGLQYFWVDTCCIDKSNSAELSTAINSMFRWYKRASKCYVYLSDVFVSSEVTDAEAYRITWEEAFRQSRWFTRGWTLQELLAPASVEFFSAEGKRLGSRISLEREIQEITKIPIGALKGQSLVEFGVEERISWAAQRKTSLEEDKVYCLLGIFGVFLPLIYGEGEAYATQRLKEEILRRQEGKGTQHPRELSIPLILPFPRNEHFVGREDQLQSLEKNLLCTSIHRRMAIYGLGGCGKSALAIEFAYRIVARHPERLVFWVPAVNKQSFELAYRDIGIRLEIPGIVDDNADIGKLVKDKFSSGSLGDWLFIIDNADDPEVFLNTTESNAMSSRLSDCLPHSSRGAILFTTRNRRTAGDLAQANVIELDDLSKAEARQLLARRITREALLNDETAVGELLEILAYLPLAIVQAAAFINNNHISVSEYVSLFHDTGTEMGLLSEHFTDPNRYSEMDSTIAKTWHISFDQIRRDNPLAAECLSFIACIDRVNIPQSLLPLRGSVVQRAKAIGTLTGYAFLAECKQTEQGLHGERFFEMHRLVHMASIMWLDEHGGRATWASAAVTRLEELLPQDKYAGRETWTTYLPHAIYVTGLEGTAQETARISLLNRVGWFQSRLGQYAAAEKTFRQIWSLRETISGGDDVETLESMNCVAEALFFRGDYEAARAMIAHILARQQRVLGFEHRNTLRSRNDLAATLDQLGKHKDAELIHRETLALREKMLGPKHPDTLNSMNNLALTLERLRKYKDAELIHRETLALREKMLGPKHPVTLNSMNNLAMTLEKQGKYKDAELILRETLALRKEIFGLKHPDTLHSMNNLAFTLDSQGKHEDAILIHRETLALRKEILGPKHPDTLHSMNNLAFTLDCQGKHENAELIHRETLALREKTLGPKHPDTLNSMNNLAVTLHFQGKHEDAEIMQSQIIELLELKYLQDYSQTLALLEKNRRSPASEEQDEDGGITLEI